MNKSDVRKIRKTYGMTQASFASALGVSPQATYFWERGVNEPSEYHKIILHRLVTMAKNPKLFARAMAALEQAKFMRPGVPSDSIPGSSDLSTCGLGRLLLALFQAEEDFGLSSLSGVMFKLSKDKKKVSFNESLIRPLEDGTQFRLDFIDKKKAVRIKKMLEKAVAQLKIAISGLSKQN